MKKTTARPTAASSSTPTTPIIAFTTNDDSPVRLAVMEPATFRAPSVEDHLRTIRQALALAVVAVPELRDAGDRHDGVVLDSATTALQELCDHAYRCATELHDAFPGQLHNLHIVPTTEGGDR